MLVNRAILRFSFLLTLAILGASLLIAPLPADTGSILGVGRLYPTAWHPNDADIGMRREIGSPRRG